MDAVWQHATLFSHQYLVDVLYTKMHLDSIFLLRGVFC